MTMWVMIRLEPDQNGSGASACICRGTPRECLTARDRDRERHPKALYRLRPANDQAPMTKRPSSCASS
jgi:hypothetical protein